MPYVAGVDLGTTYSAAAIVGPDGLTIVDLGTRSMLVPSVVAVRSDGEVLTGGAAERRLVLEPSRTASEFKRRLGDPTPLLLGGVPYGAEALTGHLLKSIVALVSEREGAPPAVVGLSHPANYGTYKVGLLEEAARYADVPVATFVPEPVAAAVNYSQTESVDVGDVIAVYDLGGGTFDASVVQRTERGFEVVGRPDGMDRFGGIDMDAAVLGHVRNVVGDDVVSARQDDPAVLSGLARLREECRGAKEALSGDTEAVIPLMLPGLHTDVRLTRAEFEDMIRPRIRETLSVLGRTVASAGLEMSDVNRVLLVGGSSRIPLVGEMVRQEIGRPVALDAHPKLTVALGTARVAQDEIANPSGSSAGAATAVAASTTQAKEPDATPEAAAVIGRITPAQRVVRTDEKDPPGPQADSDRGISGRTWGIAAAALVGAAAVVAAFLYFGSDRSAPDAAPPLPDNPTTLAATASVAADPASQSVALEHPAQVTSAVFAPDGARILTASADTDARLWDLDGASLITMMNHTAPVTSAVFSPDGSYILTASADDTAVLMDIGGAPLATLEGHTADVTSAVFAPDGAHILTASADTDARLWDLDGASLITMMNHTAPVTSAVFSPDGSYILTASADDTAVLMDIGGAPLATLEGHTADVTSAIFAPDGAHILTASADTDARLWDLDGTSLITMTKHSGPVTSAVFSPDGSYILTASADDTAVLMNLEGAVLATLEGHTGDVASAVFSPDGSRILTASADTDARLWDLDGTTIATFDAHTAPVTSAVFSPDGSYILTASTDGTARIWKVPSS